MNTISAVVATAKTLELVELETLRRRCEALHAENQQLTAEVRRLEDLADWHHRQLVALTANLHSAGHQVGMTRQGQMGIVAAEATPEMLDQLADDHSANGRDFSAATLRAMAQSWRATERALHATQAENSRMAATLHNAALSAARCELAATSTLNILTAEGTGSAKTAKGPA